MTDHKCCVIYGKLPPQTRADQARRFNDPESGYDILVASDAIGMGLNLNIKRIVFNSIFKFNGEKIARLNHSEIKQISGRAGRRNSPYPNGEVSCRDPRDLGYIRRCMSGEIEPIRKAALLPTEAHIELFSEAIHAYDCDGKTQNSYPDLHQILKQFSAMATVKGDFFLGRQTEMQIIAKRLKNIPIRLRDAYIMCLSPTTDNSLQLLESFATKVSQGEVFGLPSRSVPKKAKSFDDLSYLCNIYSDVDLFMWLQYKFPPGNQVELAAALARKEQTMQYINAALSATETLKLNHCYLKQANRHRSSWEMENGGPSSHNSNDDDEFVSGGFVDDQKEQFIFVGDGYNSADDDDDDEEYAYSNFKDKDAVKYL
jgi:ATP-dependent RNA helicase SUPV3L1/SUV3